MTDARALARAISEVDQKDFFAAMAHDDPLTVVIRATIFLENQLIGFIEDNVASPAQLKKLRLDYDGRIYLAAVLGLRPSLVTPLSALGNIRNKFAHRLNAKFTEADADNFYKNFSSEDKLFIEKVYQQTRKKLNSDKPEKIKSLSPLDRLALYAVTLRGALVVARTQGIHSKAAVDRE